MNYKYKYKFYENCPDGTYDDNFDCIDCDEKCSLCSKKSTERNLCLSCNNLSNYYEKYIESINIDTLFKECFKSPKGFYFDSVDLLYKPCYNSCNSCETNGNEENHNCSECKNEYKFELQLNNYFNCYSKCLYYFYIDENNKYKCTLNLKCPEKYNKLIEKLSKCIDKCDNDNENKYDYKNKCLMECPIGTITVNNNHENDQNYFCNEINKEEEIDEIFEEDSNEDILIKDFEKYFTSEYYNTTKIEEGKDEIYQEETFTITFTSSENQKNNI